MQIVSTTLTGSSQDIIGDALRSVVDWVDACIVIDTGVSDGTLEVAREVAGDKLVVHELPWRDDFAAARNFALRVASEAGAEWALTLDTDERIVVGEADVRGLLTARTAGVLLVESADRSYAKERLVRLPTKARWVGSTHEALAVTPEIRKEVLPGLLFHELPKDQAAFQRKLERDVAILERQVQRRPHDPRWHYYLGETHRCMERYREAIAAFEACVALRGWDEEAAWAYYQAARCHHALGDHVRAVECCALGSSRHAGLAELPWLASFVSYESGSHAQAVYWARMAIPWGWYRGDGKSVPRIGFRHLPALYEGPYDVLRFALKALGDEEGAAEAERHLHLAMATRLAATLPDATSRPLELDADGGEPVYRSSHQALARLARSINDSDELGPLARMELLQLLPDEHSEVLDARAACGYYCKDQRPELFQIGVESLRKLLDDPRHRSYVEENRTRLESNAAFYGTPWLSMADEPETLYALVDEINAELDREDLPREARYQLEQRRGVVAPRDTVRGRYGRHPTEVVERLCRRDPARKSGRIALTVTTCRRLSLFKESIDSFLNCCLDLDMIDRWILVDDNSSVEDRAEMRRLYPFFEVIERGPEQRGHARGLNLLWKLLEEHDVEHVLHTEDDRVFLRPKPYVQMGLDILEHGAEHGVAQVVYSRYYADSWNDWHRYGGVRMSRRDPFLRYVIQEPRQGDPDEPRGGPLSRHAWPHFSLNPSLIHFGRLRRDAFFDQRFDEEHQYFEGEFALRYEAAGYKTAFPDDIFVLHTGKLFWEQHTFVKDAYQLNRHNRFDRRY